MWDPYGMFESVVLPNGLTVHAAHWKKMPWERVGILIHSGAISDPVGLEGVAHFVEHMVSENATISKDDIRAHFEDCGGAVMLGKTGYPSTCYKFFAPIDRSFLTGAFSIFGQMLLLAKLEKSLERERLLVIEEFNSQYPFEAKLELERREREMVFSGEWPSRSVRPLGHPDSIAKITQWDLQAFYNTHYVPANISIVGVGGLKLSRLVELISKSPFAMSRDGLRTPLMASLKQVPPPKETQHIFDISARLGIVAKNAEYRSVAKIPGNIGSQVIRIAGNMLTETLTKEVRERRAWTYDIGTSRNNLRYVHVFSVDCTALNPVALDSIEDVVIGCIDSIASDEALFKRTKQRALASVSMTDIDGNELRNESMNDLVTHQRIVSLKEFRGWVEKVTMDDIRGLLQWISPEQRWTLIKRP